ncbi:chalcone-flavanone isomerase-domain-containing protein [Pseudomassariella vexata]|uniref:Chalcone-flavanone isomerase-domain-containing protein n=1 Tax=Pseudomassariella vexata TaxID=1141098 RepID=A0A1Y2EHZ7_9PEZI|nr:chalcone-flavanone isomerase-domain-containing protein [Pseudomassariella vexata]ORY70934.1 chalcone-flavanone isomerase-domain-containing protein [Pseudomassariella vexata]
MRSTRFLVRPDVLVRSLQTPIRRPPQSCLRAPRQTRTFLMRPRTSTRAVERLDINGLRHKAYDYHLKRHRFLQAGALAGVIAFTYTAYLLYLELQKPKKMDTGLPSGVDPFSTEGGSKRKTVIHDADGKEMVPTGYKGVPSFPRTLDLDMGTGNGQETVDGVEYTLVGLGMRSVSFLGIYVYLVGYYIATSDIAAIQSKLVKEVNPIATTLVPSERDDLRRRLLDPFEGEKLWREILDDVKPRSIFRIVPVKDTDFHHLRDGFVRAIMGRTQALPKEHADEGFARAMQEFRALWNRGKAPNKSELLMVRDERGVLTVVFDAGKGKGQNRGTVGRVLDERVSKALWMNYLAGRQVASEPARKNIVEGIMEFVERPVGTVAAQVVVSHHV